MEEVDHGTHACCLGKITVRDQVEFRYKHLLRWKKTNEIWIVIGGQARQDG